MKARKGIRARLYSAGIAAIRHLTKDYNESQIIISTLDEYDENPWPTVWWLIAGVSQSDEIRVWLIDGRIE